MDAGVDAGVLPAEGGAASTGNRCSCDRDRRRRGEGQQGPVGCRAGPRARRPLLAKAEAGRGAGGEAELAAGRARPGDQAPPACSVALPPLWQRRLETGAQTLEPPGRHGDRQRASSSGSDRERQCRLVGGAEGGPAPSLRSLALTAPRLALGLQGPGGKGMAGPAAPWLPTGCPPPTTFQGCLSSGETRRRDG